jgi:phytoene dehydrogenase-like protein
MSEHYDVVVAGGGLAGLTCAAYCARAGASVLLCEKNAKTGGLVNTFCHDGFAFDAGIRAFEDSGVIDPMLASLEIDLPLVQNPVSVGIGGDRVRLRSKASLGDYAALLKMHFPGEVVGIDRIKNEIETVMRHMDVLYGIENPLFLQERLHDPKYLTKTLLPWLIRYSVSIKKAERLNEPVEQYLRKFTENRPLIDMICQHFFTGTPTFFALSYFGLYLDYRYPLGGTGMLATRLTERFRALGGEVLFNAPVKKVFPDRRQAVLDKRSVTYDALVWAADQTALYDAVRFSMESPPGEQQRRIVRQSKGIDSVLTLFIGTDLPPEQIDDACGAHAFYTPRTAGLSSLLPWRDAADGGNGALDNWVRRYLANTTYEISVPALRDASLAPEGETGLIVSTLFDYHLALRYAKAGDYDRFKALCSKQIFDMLEQTFLPNLRNHVKFSFCGPPLTLARETGNRDGAITGWAFTNTPMPAVNRFHSIKHAVDTPFAHIYQCGHWTFSPAGLPVAIMTGKLAADAVGRRFRKGGHA